VPNFSLSAIITNFFSSGISNAVVFSAERLQLSYLENVVFSGCVAKLGTRFKAPVVKPQEKTKIMVYTKEK